MTGQVGTPSSTSGPRVGRGLSQPPSRVGAHWTFGASPTRCANVSLVFLGADKAILTERDLTRRLNAGLGPKDPVAWTCVTDMIAVDHDTTVVRAATGFRPEIRHLLVQNFRGEVIGVVSISDLGPRPVRRYGPSRRVLHQQTLSVKTDIGPD